MPQDVVSTQNLSNLPLTTVVRNSSRMLAQPTISSVAFIHLHTLALALDPPNMRELRL